MRAVSIVSPVLSLLFVCLPGCGHSDQSAQVPERRPFERWIGLCSRYENDVVVESKVQISSGDLDEDQRRSNGIIGFNVPPYARTQNKWIPLHVGPEIDEPDASQEGGQGMAWPKLDCSKLK